MELKVKKLSPEAKLPLRVHEDDAGLDFFSIEDIEVKNGEYCGVKTGISLEIPPGCVGLIRGKSGLATKGIDAVGGVIDAGYRGEIIIQLRSFSSNDYRINKGDKVAQMLIQKVELPDLVEVDELSGTKRGSGGFGSTGI